MTNAEARCNKSLRPRKPEGSLGRTAQDVHLDSHTAPELCGGLHLGSLFVVEARTNKWGGGGGGGDLEYSSSLTDRGLNEGVRQYPLLAPSVRYPQMV